MLRTIDAARRPAEGAEDEGTPVSVKIRERLQAARRRFNANDNIAEFIEPGELEQLLDEVEGKMKGVLESLVIDLENDHNTENTARRVAKMYLNEVFRGRYVATAVADRIPERGASQRADDRRPDHRSQRLFAPFLPDHRQALDRRACPTSRPT